MPDQNLYCIAHLPDGQRMLAPYSISDPELMWEEIAANNARNRAIREGHANGRSVVRVWDDRGCGVDGDRDVSGGDDACEQGAGR